MGTMMSKDLCGEAVHLKAVCILKAMPTLVRNQGSNSLSGQTVFVKPGQAYD